MDGLTQHMPSAALSWAQDRADLWLTRIEEFVSAIPVVGWIAASLGVAALCWVVASARASVRLGPIEIEPLTHDEPEESKLLALTAAFRQQLDDIGLRPPPAVPQGSPQAKLIEAVAASPMPQGPFVAKVLEILPSLPRPLSYKVSSVLTGVEDAKADGEQAAGDKQVPVTTSLQLATGSTETAVLAAVTMTVGTGGNGEHQPAASAPGLAAASTDVGSTGNAGPCGVSFWLQPVNGDGGSYLDTVPGCPTHQVALRKAAARIYQRISKDASDVFPLWVRWPTAEALLKFVDGCEARRPAPGDSADPDPEAAVAKLLAAQDLAPFNILARLELANLCEQYASRVEVAVEGEDAEKRRAEQERHIRTQLRAQALGRYLDVASLWPELVQPRYRAAITAAALAYGFQHLPPNLQKEVMDHLSLPGSGSFDKRLRRLASREARATLQLLRPYYALVRERRLRTAYEPKGPERRRLKHAASISKHCIRVRTLAEPGAFWWQPELLGREAAVHVRHLILGVGRLSWESYYNAACFDALVLQVAPPRFRWRRNWVRRRALRRLDHAIREAGPHLPHEWVSRDPDFAYFR